MEAADYFRNQAQQCRRLADGLSPCGERDGLLMLARHYEEEARRAASDAPPRPVIPAG
jgi:hypothetical protein